MTTMTIPEKLDKISHLPGARLLFDGCHKIYVVTTKDEEKEALSDWGYDRSDLYPASAIRALWDRSCGLRFVSNFNLTDSDYCIAQGEEPSCQLCGIVQDGGEDTTCEKTDSGEHEWGTWT